MIRQKTWLLSETHFPFIMVKSKMNLQSFWASPMEMFLLDYLKAVQVTSLWCFV